MSENDDIKALREALRAQPLTVPTVTMVEKAALQRILDRLEAAEAKCRQKSELEAELLTTIADHLRTIAGLTAENEALRRDAERIERLASLARCTAYHGEGYIMQINIPLPGFRLSVFDNDDVRAAIDALAQAEKGGGNG